MQCVSKGLDRAVFIRQRWPHTLAGGSGGGATPPPAGPSLFEHQLWQNKKPSLQTGCGAAYCWSVHSSKQLWQHTVEAAKNALHTQGVACHLGLREVYNMIRQLGPPTWNMTMVTGVGITTHQCWSAHRIGCYCCCNQSHSATGFKQHVLAILTVTYPRCRIQGGHTTLEAYLR
jgi:hypothetical protein